MARIHKIPDDFEAMIRIFSTAEGGRMSPPFNGIRWDFAYAESQAVGELYMIHPDFYDARGDSLPTDQALRWWRITRSNDCGHGRDALQVASRTDS